MAATVAALAVIVSVRSVGSDGSGTTASAGDPTAVDVATGYVRAYGSLDRDQVATYLADDPDLGTSRVEDRWYRAVGFTLLLDSCEQQETSTAGTQVRCEFDYHALHSELLGRGPYSGNVFYVTVRDGKVAAADYELDFLGNGFSTQMWEPFATWVARAHPRDAAVMYADWPSQNSQA